ncbi:MAG: 3-isopropylmalate dehydratase small subunit, partial [Nitrospirae bacterium]|nr:3-isopropylmalate dehydratase small subunit [Nitrospirota bacterium]
FEVNNINVVIASSFARIFRQNMFNCGMLAIELSEGTIDRLFRHNDGTAEITFDFQQSTFTVSSGKGTETIAFQIAEFDRALIEADGWVGFADAKY